MVPDIGISNGVMSVVLNYAKAMPEGVIFDVMYFQETPENRKAEIEALGGRVFKVDKPSPKDVVSKKYASFFIEHKGEWAALHIHAPHFAVFIAPSAKKNGIKKICVHSHTTSYSLKSSSIRNKLLSLYAKYLVKDKFACSSESGKLWYGNAKFTVLKNAIDCSAYSFSPEERRKVRAEMGIADNLVICNIGRTDIPQKNHTFIFKVFSEIKKTALNAKLLLIGAEETESLKSLSLQLSIAYDISYLGFRSDVASLLQGCDLFLFPSISEGLPVSVVEAQAAGLPVLMSESITKEVVLLDSTVSLSLDKSAEDWSKTAISLTDVKRTNTFDILQNKGWDINAQAKFLNDYYCEV